jgi:hypothetical protein
VAPGVPVPKLDAMTVVLLAALMSIAGLVAIRR